MELKDIPYEIIDWNKIETAEVKGETGKAFWKTKNFCGVRLRIIEKMPGFKADHFCNKGHIIYILEGEMVIEFENGESIPVSKGESVFLSDDCGFGHSTYSEKGVKYFIID